MLAISKLEKRKLGGDFLKILMPFFLEDTVDYPSVRSFIEKEFSDDAVLYKSSMHAVDTLEAIEMGEPPDISYQLLIAKGVLNFVIGVGRIKAARLLIGLFKERWGEDKFLELTSVLTLSDPSVEQLRYLDESWREYQVHDQGAGTTVMLFCGVGNRFGVAINAFMLWLAGMEVNAVYLRDFQKLLYLGGISELGDLPTTIAAMKKDLAAIGTKRLVCMGNSGGVYGALYYGQLLGADEILCFAGPTSLEAGNQVASERPVYEAIGEEIRQGKLQEPDLRSLYTQNPIRVRMFYGADYEFDAIQTKTFAGLDNVSFEPLQDFDKHFVIGELARLGQLDAILASAVNPQSE
jgi:hypothetical protein